jgi:PAS domain S-box-containing protein
MKRDKRIVSLLEEASLMVRKMDSLQSAILNVVPTPIICIHNRRIIYANQAVASVSGWKPSELINRKTSVFYRSKRDYIRIGLNIQRGMVQRKNYTAEGEFKKKDGQVIVGRFHVARLEDDLEDDRYVILFEDISGIRTMQAMINATPAYVMLTDREGHIITTNKKWPSDLRMSARKMTGRNMFELIHPSLSPSRKAHFNRAVASGKPVYWQDKSRYRHWGNTLYPILSEAGEVHQVAIYSLDISERKRVEEELAKAQKLESIGMLAGGIAHDFNNLLAIIMGYLEMLKMKIPASCNEFNHVIEAEKAVLRSSDLTKELITFSKGGNPIKRPVNMEKFLRAELNRPLENPLVTCKASIREGLWPVKMDASQMSRVIHHLVRNAAEAMPTGGDIHLSVENIHMEGATSLPLAPGPYIHMAVSDAGCGIPEKNLSKIFDPYFTSKPMGHKKGLGLGLSICFSIIKKHHGAITVASKMGTGTTFHIYLPAHGDVYDDADDARFPISS